MGKKLKDNLSSRYFEAANKMKSQHARRRIAAYVESYDDIFFWRSVLSDFEDDTRYFQVMLPSRLEHLERGKKAVLMNLLMDKVGRDMIACVDADYDYLMQGATEMSKQVTTNPYVFHTYAYAIENLQCYAPSLYETSVMVTLNDHHIFDMEAYLRDYSQAIFPLFVWSIWFYRTPNYGEFTMMDFLRVIEPGHFTMVKAEGMVANVRRKVGKRINQLQQKYPNNKESYLQVKEDIKRLGVTPDTTYLYIQGHHLFDKVVVPMLTKVCLQLVRERETEISQQSMHGTQQRNELSCYRNSIQDIPSMLKKNTRYKQSEPVARIQADLQRYLELTKQNHTNNETDREKPVPR